MENTVNSSIGRITTIIPPITLDIDTLNNIDSFANKRVADSKELYKKRGEVDEAKIWLDIYTGAMAEFAAYEYLRSLGFNVNSPDLSIHENKRKSYEPDLLSSTGYRFHVKSNTIESCQRHETSWLFQRRDPITIVPKDEDYIVLCTVNYQEGHVQVHGYYSAKDMLKKYSRPKIDRYAMTKRALYLKDIGVANGNTSS